MKTQIKARANSRKRTFTIYRGPARFRTYTVGKAEFICMQRNTSDNWAEFLRSSDNYYQIK